MVFKTLMLLGRNRGPDPFWRKRRIFQLTSHYMFRARNTLGLATRLYRRSLFTGSMMRAVRRLDMQQLWNTRIHAGCKEHGLHFVELREALHREHILLDRRSLSTLAAYEPYSFRALCEIAQTRLYTDEPRIRTRLRRIMRPMYVHKV